MCFRLPHSSPHTDTDRSRHGRQHQHQPPSSVVSAITSLSSSRSTARHHVPMVQPRPPSTRRRQHTSEQPAAATTNAAPREHRRQHPQPCRRGRHHRDRASARVAASSQPSAHSCRSIPASTSVSTASTCTTARPQARSEGIKQAITTFEPAGFEPITSCQNTLQALEEAAEKTSRAAKQSVPERRTPHHGAEEHLLRSVPTGRPRQWPTGAIIRRATMIQRYQTR
jgi:hypothetical protein